MNNDSRLERRYGNGKLEELTSSQAREFLNGHSVNYSFTPLENRERKQEVLKRFDSLGIPYDALEAMQIYAKAITGVYSPEELGVEYPTKAAQGGHKGQSLNDREKKDWLRTTFLEPIKEYWGKYMSEYVLPNAPPSHGEFSLQDSHVWRVLDGLGCITSNEDVEKILQIKGLGHCMERYF